MFLGAPLAVAVLLTAMLASASGNPCNSGGWAGNCEVTNQGSYVEVGASVTAPGSGGGDGGSGGGGGWRPEPEPEPSRVCDTDPRCAFTVVTIPDVTVDDLAAFRPAGPAVGGEPAGFGVAGLPTNLVATASEQLIPGTILDWDVVVRFTPVGFVFDHGDGTSAQSDTGGRTWAQLGQPQFSPTATSHVYAARGSYTVSATVQYAASVDFGTGWRDVPGVVSVGGGSYPIRVVEASTALVDLSCVENPTGPGC